MEKWILKREIIVWDLFGGLNGSVGQSIDNNKYKIYTFDILPKTKNGKDNIILDLSKENVIKELTKYPLPDIIVASPMCNSFSIARRYKDGGTAGWIINSDKTLTLRNYDSWKKNMSVKRNDKWYGVRERALMGKNSIINTINIIEYFKPKYWYIENPRYSLLWLYIKNNLKIKYIENITTYGSYGFFAKKPTIFLSNIELNLKNDKHISTGIGIDDISTKDRSDIPNKLIQDIFNKFKENK